LVFLNCIKEEGVGVPKGITGFKGKRGKLRTRPQPIEAPAPTVPEYKRPKL
jgi:hypothetical protein